MTLSAVQADIFLHHLEIQSKNPDKLAEFYANIMDMKTGMTGVENIGVLNGIPVMDTWMVTSIGLILHGTDQT